MSVAGGEPLDLNARIRAVLAELGDIDPQAAANVILDALSDEEADALAVALVADRVRAFKRAANARTAQRRPAGSARWRAVADAREQVDVLRQAVIVGNTVKPLAECTPHDVAVVVHDERRKAQAADRRAKVFDLLRKLMIRHNAEYVADLPAELVRRVVA